MMQQEGVQHTFWVLSLLKGSSSICTLAALKAQPASQPFQPRQLKELTL